MHCGRSVSYWQTCSKVKDNEENCARARKRASRLLPLLSQVYNRLSLDPRQMCPAIDNAVKGIAEQLDIQVGCSLGQGAPCRFVVVEGRKEVDWCQQSEWTAHCARCPPSTLGEPHSAIHRRPVVSSRHNYWAVQGGRGQLGGAHQRLHQAAVPRAAGGCVPVHVLRCIYDACTHRVGASVVSG